MRIDSMARWPHQRLALDEYVRLSEDGCRRICIQSPTGGGKTLIMIDIAIRHISAGQGVTLFCNRKMLIDQMKNVLSKMGVDHGVRAAGHFRTIDEAFQIASVQTEYSRLIKRKTWRPHDSGLIIVDEAHLNENNQCNRVYEVYLENGATKVGFTATPLGLEGRYDKLIQAGTNSQLRECGALVRAIHHGPTEPDLRNVRKIAIGEDLTDEENAKVIMVPGIHGRVIDWFRRLNPQWLPSIGFAPGVPESLGFAEAFEAAGIPAAHIDGEMIWIRGEQFGSTESKRQELLELSRSGDVKIIWNRFVLREAIDMPWLRHGILATVFGSLQSYLQSGGRLLRASPSTGKESVVVQDHGGNWHRHGSLNSDRVWRLGDTNRLLAQLRRDSLTPSDGEEPKEKEPFLCPRCSMVMSIGASSRIARQVVCPNCGNTFDFSRRSRPVIQSNGELIEHFGNIFRERKTEMKNDTLSKWTKIYWRARKSGTMTFSQAAGLFFSENGYMPPRNLPLMPKTQAEWYLKVASVPFDRLYPKENQ